MKRKEAIEVVRKNYPHVSESGTQFETALRTLVPELEESEDEKIRKSLIDLLKNDEKHYLKEIAWLEKTKDLQAEVEKAHKEACQAHYNRGVLTGINNVMNDPEGFGLVRIIKRM